MFLPIVELPLDILHTKLEQQYLSQKRMPIITFSFKNFNVVFENMIQSYFRFRDAI